MGLKWNKRLLENKRWEPLDATVCCMDQWLWGYICLYYCELIFWLIKNNKAEDYTHKYNGKPFHEEKNIYKSISITVVESTENVYHVTRQNLYFVPAP